MEGESDIKELEFYVTVEYYKKKKHASENLEIKNPHSTPREITSSSSTHQIKKAKGSPAEQKPASKKEEKGLLSSLSDGFSEMWDWAESFGKAKRDKPHTVQISKEKSPVLVGIDQVNKKEEKRNDGKCPNCDKDITAIELKQIFTDADQATLTKVATIYSKYMKELNMNTCWNKAHFFAQARIESGSGLHVKSGENFNWYWKSLIKEFSAFQSEEGKINAKKWGREELKPALPAVTLENQKKIANWAYSHKFSKGKELGNSQENDGWNFRGKGLLQLTGRSAYEYANTYTKKEGADIISNPDLVVSNVSIAVLSSMAFWKWKSLNTSSNLTKDVINKICPKVGKNTSVTGRDGKCSTNHEEKKKIFDGSTSEVFKIDECRLGKSLNKNNEKGTVIFISGKGSKYISSWLVYKTDVYLNMTLDTFKKLKRKEDLPNPDFTTFLSRDAHGDKEKYGKHSDKRYGTGNETPPGEYYLIPATPGQSYKMYISSDGKSPSIKGPDGNRDGVAIHQYSPKFAIGCLTTVTGKDTSIVNKLLNILNDLPLKDDKPVRIILEERKVKEEQWNNNKIGTIKWTGIL
ncbi:hypothetical protein JJC03_05440 [Flavobacterium oreochromis]|uniref:glycoside hydrolase family 19 protein n=1 Tax=Flavobacterium oreochromis TaxID=2906078 RepID=UPI001CE6BD01|nr:hypothetical protein [Flavobacterium oreochromis]QYS87351.1 hypothetical protein JJC03_05440 [Flavobacterium oreochromis]